MEINPDIKKEGDFPIISLSDKVYNYIDMNLSMSIFVLNFGFAKIYLTRKYKDSNGGCTDLKQTEQNRTERNGTE